MSSPKTLKQILAESKQCFLVPCVYDCASARAVEMCNFPVMLLSGGEVSISRNGVIDYGFTNLTDLEEVISRVTETTSIPLIADIEDGFGGPLAVYRAAKRLAAAGAAAIQLEDSADMEDTTAILPRNKYMAKVRAALEALQGTNCLLIARSNADPADPAQMQEGCERLQEAIEIGKAQGQMVIAMMVLVGSTQQAAEMAKIVTGPKIFADVRAYKDADGKYKPSVTMEELSPLGFVMCSSHYTMKAAMEGMLEHGLQNYANQSVAYTFATAPASGIESFSASGLYDPQAYLQLENKFTNGDKAYTIVGHQVEDYPSDKFRVVPIEHRL
ncbi:MAG: isocitrate lyase/phosphoenolpyruvate mutase family protein [Gemmiger sp.]|nr:isocitrate lyase/phosphoenolpyruvate mutase family protein [Gemmiger sp.]